MKTRLLRKVRKRFRVIFFTKGKRGKYDEPILTLQHRGWLQLDLIKMK